MDHVEKSAKAKNVEQTVQDKITGKKVMVFSKSSCPHCNSTKRTIQKYIGKGLKKADYEVWEIQREANCNQIQAVLRKHTGSSTVPRVFINGKCIGGNDQIRALDDDGKLSKMLTSKLPDLKQ